MNTRAARWVVLAVVVASAAAAVWIFSQFTRSDGATDAGTQTELAARNGQVWTCSMHPQVRLPKPGKCPICSMPLIPATPAAAAPAAKAGTGKTGHAMLKLSDHARAMARVETVPVERRQVTHEIRAVGKVQYNEAALAVINSRVEGYVERLYVDFTGVEVKKGDHLVDIYSPDFVVAQRELLVALENPQDHLLDAAKLKLRRWGLTEAQVAEFVQRRKVSEQVTLLSPIDGTVIERIAIQQGMVKAGDMLYKLANLDSVWIYLDIYESQLAWVQTGQTAEIQAEAFPNEKFSGRIWFINPVLTEETRTVKVLVTAGNADHRLKPGMFVSTLIRVPILASGKAAPTPLAGQFTCVMHPQVVVPQAGKCSICGMALRQIPGGKTPVADSDMKVLVIQVTAVLDSGIRKLVYIEHAPGEFMPAEVTLGARAGDVYPVLGGLKEGDRVATRGNFLLDSQLQIQGLPSLLYAEGGTSATAHQHGTPGAEPPQAPAGNAGEHKGHAAPPKPGSHPH